MWLVAEAEDVLRNDTWLDLDLALDVSRLQSVAYCHPPNVAAWNCTRQAPPEQYPPQTFLHMAPSIRERSISQVYTAQKNASKLAERMIHDKRQDHFFPFGWSLNLWPESAPVVTPPVYVQVYAEEECRVPGGANDLR